MYNLVSRDAPPANLTRQRIDAEARVAVKRDAEGRSRLAELYQRGSAKIRLPKTYDGVPEAVVMNTAGGLTGGDSIAFSIEVGDGAAMLASTQAAERVYRAVEGSAPAQAKLRLKLGAGARLDWLAQETILFDGGRLVRRIEIDMAADARLLMVEPIVFGREAMGETLNSGHYGDLWRLRRAGRLVFADGLRIEAPISERLERKAALDGRRAMASLLYVAPDAEDRLGGMREALEQTPAGTEGAASAFDGLLTARLTAPSGGALMRALAALLERFRGAPTPRGWRC